MSRLFAAAATDQTVIVPLLLDRRTQTVAALALALAGGLLFGVDTTEARGSIIGGHGGCRTCH